MCFRLPNCSQSSAVENPRLSINFCRNQIIRLSKPRQFSNQNTKFSAKSSELKPKFTTSITQAKIIGPFDTKRFEKSNWSLKEFQFKISKDEKNAIWKTKVDR